MDELVDLIQNGHDVVGSEVSVTYVHKISTPTKKIANQTHHWCGCIFVQLNESGVPHRWPYDIYRLHNDLDCKDHGYKSSLVKEIKPVTVKVRYASNF